MLVILILILYYLISHKLSKLLKNNILLKLNQNVIKTNKN
jgi:hypothetical protein